MVLLGDYLDCRVSKCAASKITRAGGRPTLSDVVHVDQELWGQLTPQLCILGNQEERIAALVPSDGLVGDLARLVRAPRRRLLGGALLVHGHELAWSRRSDGSWLPGGPDRSGRLLVAGHSHQSLVVSRSSRPGGAVHVIQGNPGRRIEIDESTRFINVGAARGASSQWLLAEVHQARLPHRQQWTSITFMKA
ncbi:hypothetical protein GCM10027456_82570 [Kineosporia babensis]